MSIGLINNSNNQAYLTDEIYHSYTQVYVHRSY